MDLNKDFRGCIPDLGIGLKKTCRQGLKTDALLWTWAKTLEDLGRKLYLQGSYVIWVIFMPERNNVVHVGTLFMAECQERCI